MAEFLLEIGCEEIPAGWLPKLTAELADAFAAAAERAQLAPSDIEAYSTPRRLVVAAQLKARQDDSEEQVWGPALGVARDAGGGWTKAAEGFARKNGVAPDDLKQAPKDPAKPDQLHLLHVRQTEGRPAADVVAELLPGVLRGLSFPKRMSWDAWLDDGKGSFPFGRPIRWLVALLDGAVVPFTIYAEHAGSRGAAIVEAGDRTWGHRFVPPESAGRPVPVTSFDDFVAKLERACVILDPAARVKEIGDRFTDARGDLVAKGGHYLLGRGHWADLVEHPFVVAGKIPDELTALPLEVMATVLRHHQKYVPLGAAEATKITGFAAVIDGDGRNRGEIVRGMERVVVARLRDAYFFWGEDRARPLEERIPDLAGVTFHRDLGSYLEKAERLAALIDALAGEGWVEAGEAASARAAARLAKADLTTAMVGEFAELQGFMGGRYLEDEGAPATIVGAVRWHYHPVSVEPEAKPQGEIEGAAARAFAAVSLVDKLDTLAGYFGLGLEPTGSRDPYGLRRAGQGLVCVLLGFWPKERVPDLHDMISRALEGHAERARRPREETASSLEAFLRDRLEQVLVARGHARDVVQAVLAAPDADALADVVECASRVAALDRVRSEAGDDFEHLAVAFKRANNILKDVTPGEIDPDRFVEPAERALHDAIISLAEGDAEPADRLRALRGLRGPIDRFFDDVLVMAEEAAVRDNRLALLDAARRPFHRIADISKLGG